MKYKLFEVGGKVRDELLGLKSKDIDYSVVVEEPLSTIDETFSEFHSQLLREGFEVFEVNPECFTIRSRFPKDHVHSGVADFVLAREEVGYVEGTRTPICRVGTLRDDLVRRDFTVNAMARSESGEIIDLFNGREDLNFKILDTPVDPLKSFNDDPLRIIRGFRFAITKGFTLSERVKIAIRELGVHGLEKVSLERIQKELEKCFKANTLKTLRYMDFFRTELNMDLEEYAFKDTGLWLLPTNKS